MSHNPLTRDFERRLAKLQRLAELVEDSFVEQTAALEARVTAGLERFPKAEQQDYFEAHIEDFYELADELPTLLRYSVLTGADTGLEVYLNDTCATFAEVHGATVALSDLRGSGIERARDYLKKVAQISFPEAGPEWMTVRRLHQLRNSIVHADGYFPPERTDIREWASSIDGLRFTSAGVISLGRNFTSAAVTAYHAFALQLDAACEPLGLWRSVFPAVEDS